MRDVLFTMLCLLQALLSSGRPLVRNLPTHTSFQTLLEHHKIHTGLPVVVDFFSHTCGPCKMIAPHFKTLAQEYKDTVVFSKVDVNANRQTSSHAQVRSMPTFHFYLDGVLRHQFSGADTNQLQSLTRQISAEAKRNNVRIDKADLLSFYQKFAPEKATDDQIEKVLEKTKNPNGGKGHRKLADALKKKYGTSPKLSPRINTAPTKAKETPKATGTLSEFETNDLINELISRNISDLVNLVMESSHTEDLTEEDQEDEEPFAEWQKEDTFAERLVILGGGPAGLSAAIYAARSGLNPLVIAPISGGQLQSKGVNVENYPGIPSATGSEVVSLMMQQAIEFGTQFLFQSVISTDFSNMKKRIVTSEGIEVESYGVIVATGAITRWLHLPSEEALHGRGVSACATCDGYLFVQKTVVVVGGGDSAVEEALYLAETSSQVHLVHRGSDLNKASRILVNRLEQKENVEVVFQDELKEYIFEQDSTELEGVLLKSGKTLEAQGVFIAIGQDPAVKYFPEVEKHDNGYIKVGGNQTNQFETMTNLDGVFAAGDVADWEFRQAVTSAGTGAIAAMEAHTWMIQHNIKDERQEHESEFMAELLREMQEEEESKRKLLEEC